MKITQDMRAGVETKQIRQQPENKQSFGKMVNTEALKIKQEGIEKLVQDIEKQGDKLARYRTFRELTKFKRMVKSFLQETVYNGLDLQKSSSFSFEGHHSTLALVKEVDDKLVELTDDVMNHEKKTVDLLGLIGEIKGLLVNIYT